MQAEPVFAFISEYVLPRACAHLARSGMAYGFGSIRMQVTLVS